MSQYVLDEIQYVIYDRLEKKTLDIKTHPIFKEYSVVFNMYGQILLTFEGQIIGYLGDRYELRKKRNNKEEK